MEKRSPKSPIDAKVTSAPVVSKSLDDQLTKKLNAAATKPEKSVANVQAAPEENISVHTKRKQSKIRMDSSEEDSDAEPMVSR